MGALDGVRIIELGQVIAGTYGTQYLADYGAEVFKVEPPTGDLGRNPVVGNIRGEGSLFISANRNKRSIVLDLKHPEGRAVLYDLVRVSDVLIENFRPGTVEKLGVDYATLREINPRLIFASTSGFGPDSPYRDAPSFDAIHQAMSGWMSFTGEPDSNPCLLGVPIADLLSGFFLTHGILAALYSRERTGRGQRIETAMLDVMLALLNYHGTMYLNTGEKPQRRGSAHEYHVPYQAFPTRDGKHIIVAPREQVFWRKLCETMGHPELADDPRFATNEARRIHREELIPQLEETFRTRDAEEWLALFRDAGIPAGPVYDVGEALSDPTVAVRQLIAEVSYPPIGQVKVLANPIKFSETPVERYGSIPALGEHTRAVLSEVLGYPDERIHYLEEVKAVRQWRTDGNIKA